MSFRSPVAWVLMLAVAVGWLFFGPRSVTVVELQVEADQLTGVVNGAPLRLEPAAGALPVTTTVHLYTAPAERSQYYQRGEPAGPLALLGRAAELMQQARPVASFRLLSSTTPVIIGEGNHAPVTGIPSLPYRLAVEIIGGRVDTGFVVGEPAGRQYAFTVRPERRNLSWWTFENGQLAQRVDSTWYRVAGLATVADLAQELALLLLWTSVVALVAMGVARAAGFFFGRRVARAALDASSAGSTDLTPGPSPAGRGESWAAPRGPRTEGPGLDEASGSLPNPSSSSTRAGSGAGAEAPHPNPLPFWERGRSAGPRRESAHEESAPLQQAPHPNPLPFRERGIDALLPLESAGGGEAPADHHGRLGRAALWALLLGLPGFGLTLWACLGVLEGIPHVQDDVAYIFQAKIFALRSAWVPAPPLPQFFEQVFIVINEGRWFAKYPPGFPLLLAPAELLNVGWLVNPLCAGLTVALVYLAGRALYGHGAAVWAALLGALSPFVIFMSGSFMSHPSTMFWLALFLYCFVLSVAQPKWLADDPRPLFPGWARGLSGLVLPLLAGFAVSWAFITREASAVGVAAPFLLWGLGDLAQATRRDRARFVDRVRPYVLMSVGALPPLLIMGMVNRSQMGSPFRLAQELVGSYDRLGFGVGFGPEPEGHSPAVGIYNALVYLRELQGALFGWPLLLTLVPIMLGLIAAIASWRRGEWTWRWDLLVLAGFLGLAGIYMAWWSSTTIFGPRYWYEGTPFLLLLAGRGIAWLGEIAGPAGAPAAEVAATTTRNPPSRVGWARWVAPGAIVGLLVLYNLTQYFPGEVRRYTGYNQVTGSALRRVEEAGLRDALVFVALEPAISRRDYGKVFFANDPLLRGPVVYARDLGAEQNRRLLEHFPGRRAYFLPLEGEVEPGFGP